MRVLLVGGAVRNLLLGRPVADKDFVVTDLDEAGFMRRFPEAQKVGGHFPVFLVGGSEYALLRAEDLDRDLLARDLTINAMALDEDGQLRCHPRALEDMRGRVLRPCSPGCLDQDPLRVFRAARFAAQLPDFTAHDELVKAMRDTAARGLLETISAERVGHELLLALESDAPSRFLRLLLRARCLRPWFEELDGTDDIPAGPAPHHDDSVFGHTCKVMDRLAGNPLTTWMGLVHDLGKALTPPDLRPSHVGHEEAGAGPTRRLGERLRLSNRYLAAGEAAARLHMKAARYPELRPGTRVDLLMALHAKDLVRPMFALVAADHGRDHLDRALADLERILAVRLPEKDRDQGAQSGDRLRELRCLALNGQKSSGKDHEL